MGRVEAANWWVVVIDDDWETLVQVLLRGSRGSRSGGGGVVARGRGGTSLDLRLQRFNDGLSDYNAAEKQQRCVSRLVCSISRRRSPSNAEDAPIQQ